MSENRVLVVQCCHLPQFSYVVDQLRQRHPDWQLEGLLCPHPQLEHYSKCLHPLKTLYSRSYDLAANPPKLLIFPLLNGGYREIKTTVRMARALRLPCWESNYQGEIRPLHTHRLYLSLGKALHRPPREFTEYLNNFPFHPVGARVLLLESCHHTLISKSRERWEPLTPAPEKIIRVGRASPRTLWKQLSKKKFDGAVVFFSGEKGFTFMKCIPFLLRIPQVLVVTESNHAFYANLRELTRFLAGRILRGTPQPKLAPRILVVQTEASPLLSAAIRRLRHELYPRSQILLLCRKRDRHHFEQDKNLDQIIDYTPLGPLEGWRLRRQIRQLDADLVCALFSGRPVFRKPKLFFLSLPVRSHIVFNSQLDCYRLGLTTLPWLLRKDALSLQLEGPPQRVLFFQTEVNPTSLQALQVITQPNVVPNASISVFCSEEQRPTFEGLPQVAEVFSYDIRFPKRNLLTLWRMTRWKADVSAAILSGRPVFWKQKLLFWLIPVRHRLVLNEVLDCYFLSWRNIHWLLVQKPRLAPPRLLRSVVRACLFLPRFGYLLGWATWVKLRRARSTETEPGS